MSYSPGDWVELGREVQGARAGQRGKVTSTGFLGGLDIQLTTGARLVAVDPSTVTRAAPGGATSDSGGCAVIGLAGGAVALAGVTLAAWARARWGA